jgi:hypothetical protein
MSYPAPRVSTDTPTRQPTPELWRGQLEAFSGPTADAVVQLIDDDFKQAQLHAEDTVVGGWLLSDAASGGTATAPTNADPNGVKTITDAGGTAHFGGSLLKADGATAVANINLPSHATAPKGRVVCEALINPISTDVVFVGLTDNGADFLSSSSALGDKNYIGFFKGQAGDLTFVTSDTAVGTQVSDSATVLAAASIPTTPFKVGFAVNTDNSVEIVVNEVRYRALERTINPAALPTASLLARIEATTGANASAVALPVDFFKLVVAR